ncbi:MAG: TolC family protein [Kiritimatiellae bacterium]|nr:TolC family protein [Kiritimatiellia bacterium]
MKATIRTGCLLLIAVALGSTSCATRSPDDVFDDVQQTVAARSGKRLIWSRSSAAAEETRNMVVSLLAKELDAESAVQIALLNNQGLQATFEEIGIAQAELVQAGRLANPGFSGSVAFPDASGAKTRINLSLSQSFLDTLAIPIRKRVAAAELDKTQNRLAHDVLHLAAEVKSAIYTLQAQSKMIVRLELVAEADERAAELARMQHDAGNISDLDLFSRRATAYGSRLEATRSKTELRAGREQLNRLLGLDAPDTGWRLAELPNLPSNALPESLEALAVQQRFDLQAARAEYAGLALALGLTRRYRLIGGLEFGVEMERDTDGDKLIGPGVTVELPLFDQGQARVARMDSAFRQAEKRLAEKTLNVRSEVREARDRLVAARDLALCYRDTILPEHARIVSEAQLHYNGMLLGAYELLAARKQSFAMEGQYLDALKEYWQAHSELERAVGGSLDGPPNGSPTGQSVSLTVKPAPSEGATPAHADHGMEAKP